MEILSEGVEAVTELGEILSEDVGVVTESVV